MQQEVVAAFLSSFQLSLGEQTILRGSSREAVITDEFFRVLERVESIHSNCRMLMQSGHQTPALEIMEQMALYQVCFFVNLTKLQSCVEFLVGGCMHVCFCLQKYLHSCQGKLVFLLTGEGK